MRFARWCSGGFWALAVAASAVGAAGSGGAAVAEREARMAWWREARFGMFVHWGLYSGLAGTWEGKAVGTRGGMEWIQNSVRADTESYAKAALPRFKPKPGFAAEWARLARQAGCRYLVFTTKHHEGFALHDSQVTDYDAGSALQRDLVKEIVEACRAEGLRVGFYHSVIDWHHDQYEYARSKQLPHPLKGMAYPEGARDHAKYQEFLAAQVTELVSNYGTVDVLWWDYSAQDFQGQEAWRAFDLMALVRAKQPSIIMNNRLFRSREAGWASMGTEGYLPQLEPRYGDFITPEQHIPATGMPGVDWETCMTMNTTWGYSDHDHAWKSDATLIRNLIDIASKGGNYLLNIGPRGDGSVPEPSVRALQAIGAWMKVNGNAIYGTEASPFEAPAWGRCTRKEGPDGQTRLYLHVLEWPAEGKLVVPLTGRRPARAVLLAGGSPLEVGSSEGGITVALPAVAPDAVASVVMLDLAPGAARAGAGGAITLVENGQSAARIVIPADAIESERYAAEELRRYGQRMSGVAWEIVPDTVAPGAADILLGDNGHVRALGAAAEMGRLGPDGFVLRTVGRNLVVAGGRPRGTLNGVYTLLEEEWGVRWFTPELEVVPRVERLSVRPLDRVVVPALENRDVFWRETMRSADFAARHRLNGQHYGLQARHGGAFTVYHPFVHSFDALVPPDLCQQHPEYWPMIKGERKGGYVQRCLTHPEVRRLSIERVRQWIREHPEATIISVSQNDCINNCECPQCKAIDEAEGTPMGSLLAYVNAIATDLEKDYPRVRIDTLAYQYTRRPPKTLRPHRNVIIRLCSIECCFAHTLEGCGSRANREFRGDIVAWGPVAPLLYVWDYTPNFAHYLQTFPNFEVLQGNVQFFVKHGVKGLFEQGNYSSGGQGEMGPLRAYVLSKLLWDPETEVARHVREFTDAYYGAAGPKVREALDKVHEPVRGRECHAFIFDGPKACYLDPAILEAAERLYDEAEGLAGTEETRFRVQVARLPMWYSRIAQGRVAGEEKRELVQRFLEIARRAGVSNISEGRGLEDWGKAMLAN